ncbi:DUF1905 domain-containing protein [Candidatus Saccharibacteria bacterium]|nr:MAG: DUF1905 domain-containing protein [Candidatus Saccharibacteria bacterium]
MQFAFSSELWLYPGEGAWVFATLPAKIAQDIKLVTSTSPKRGFGSIRVRAAVNDTEWFTSIFPDRKTGSYLLPIKQDVRKRAKISTGDRCKFTIYIEDVF